MNRARNLVASPQQLFARVADPQRQVASCRQSSEVIRIVKLRFTGEWPPIEYLEQYPNWANAYDEEGEEGQDETILKPHVQQSSIDDEVSFTVGEVKTASGAKHLAFIEVIRGVPQAVHVFGEEEWGVELVYPAKKWASVRQDWLPEEQRVKGGALNDPELFPLQVVSRLPRAAGGGRIEFRIEADGSAREAI